MALLEVFIPTYNRPQELAKCLYSLKKSITNISFKDRSKVGVAIRNNATLDFALYQNLIKKYSKIFKNLGIAYFDYCISGFNIGGINNVVGGLLSSKSDYAWFLPDDDIARFDALSIAIPVLEKYSPCFVNGACVQKSRIEDYDSNESGEDDGEANSILDTIEDRSKILSFLESGNIVQGQEYIYNIKQLNKFLDDDSNLRLLHDMYPGILGIFCLQSSAPFVRLKRSLGIFRVGEPKSAKHKWRYLWWKFALIDWPKLSKKLYIKGWLNKEEMILSTKMFRHTMKVISGRPDILLGLNWKSNVNPFLLIKYHPYDYFIALINSPISFYKAVQKKLKIFIKKKNEKNFL